ncbi:chloride channel protein [Collinsella sp. zg1085]|nr:chloride channel protein [Collinsella sp. zg1085]
MHTASGALRSSLLEFREHEVRYARNILPSARLFVLVLIVSVAMGVLAWAFLTSLAWVSAFRVVYPVSFFSLPLVGIGTAWLYHSYGNGAQKGNNLVIESALAGRMLQIRMAVMTFICSVATHFAGGSAGREGTAVQIGGTIASQVSERAKLTPYDHHDLLLAGVSSAFGAVFGTPLAGAFFGMEMCFVGRLEYNACLYCLVASFTGNAITHLLGIHHSKHVIDIIPALDARMLALTVLAALTFGLVARLFSSAIHMVKHMYQSIPASYLVRAAISSGLLLLVYLIAPVKEYAGLSEWMVDAGFAGNTGFWDIGIKLSLTALTLGAGFQGGEVTPLFCLGAASGGWLATMMGLPPALLAALGMIAVFGSALNVPVTTVLLGIDLFGGAAAPYFVIVSFVAYLVAGHRGVYPAQMIVTPKRRSLADDASMSVAEAQARRHKRDIERVKQPLNKRGV